MICQYCGTKKNLYYCAKGPIFPCHGDDEICKSCSMKKKRIAYLPADLTDALAEAAEEVIKSATGAYNEKRTNVSKDKFKKLKDALAVYRGEEK